MLRPSLLVCAAVAATAAGVAAAAADMSKTNFVLVLADDQGWGDVGYNPHRYQNDAYNYTWTFNPPQTPNLDAMATGPNSIVFWRWYAGAPVCSPTRSSVLTGRTPGRECINGAEGCGTEPAWSCLDKLPLPPATFTIAEAAQKAGIATTHIGKWHLGDFFYKGKTASPSLLRSDAYSKWPVSNPGMHGFDEWHSTEASAPSSTTNCGCSEEWWNEAPGCITGGGAWHNKSYSCTNYWSPEDLDEHHKPTRPACRDEYNGTKVLQQDCVGNLTTKISGDDTAYIMDQFESFLVRKTRSGSAEQGQFMALLWLHTNHEPHPSLPQFYHGYNDSFGDPAGDYLGTLTQMDVQIGRLRQMLKDQGVSENTMLWYTADNGPHSAARDQNKYNALGATNGLRQCKASMYEGGIRVPGILEWPAMIKKNSATWHPGYVNDYLPTVLEVLGMQHPNPGWAADGMSLLPLIQKLAATPAANDTSARPDANPLVFSFGALINNNMKYLAKPSVGQCDKEPGTVLDGPMLFDLDADPTESNDLSKTEPALFAEMAQQYTAFQTSVDNSACTESECSCGSGPAPGPPPPPPPPFPPTPPAAGVSFLHGAGQCLTMADAADHPRVSLGACDGGSKWVTSPSGIVNVLNVTEGGSYLKLDLESESGHKQHCKPGILITVAAQASGADIAFAQTPTSSSGSLVVMGCEKDTPPVCVLAPASGAGAVTTGSCAAAGASSWVAQH